ncbi:hypothetical protein VUR80DRAFT_5538 [Thermomyces stellatus]
MCDYIERRLRCGHTKYIVHRWCPVYRHTHRKCPPNVIFFENWDNRLCGACMPRRPLIPAIEQMIKRQQGHQVAVHW